MGAARVSPVLVSLPRLRTPPLPGPWQAAATVIANVTFSARHAHGAHRDRAPGPQYAPAGPERPDTMAEHLAGQGLGPGSED
jgi:hypothetical protein